MTATNRTKAQLEAENARLQQRIHDLEFVLQCHRESSKHERAASDCMAEASKHLRAAHEPLLDAIGVWTAPTIPNN